MAGALLQIAPFPLFVLKCQLTMTHNMQDYLKDFMAASLHLNVSNMKNVSKIIRINHNFATVLINVNHK